DCRRWNIDRVRALFRQDLGDKIRKLPIGGESQCNRAEWFHNPHDSFTSKLDYSWLLLKYMGFGPHRCGVEDETPVHTLKDCLTSRAILSFGGLDNSTISKDYKARTLSHEFRICNFINDPLFSTNPAVKKWEKPPKGFVKINFDVLVCNNKVGYGVIVREEDGFVL
ncbi:hypothetical protein Goshw_009423, partial [Gossypium schwendimanii]|nr:hypothetical protein [Gossypium schwendimanii]